MNPLKKYVITGVIFTVITGIIFHFAYEWTGKNFLAALFFPVNESVFEHMKLVFFPMLIYSIVMSKKLINEYPCINSALASGIITGTLSVPVIFYTYTGILGFNVTILDIAVFIVSVIIAFWVIYKLAPVCSSKKYSYIVSAAVILLFICFMIFTVFPPKLGLFRNP